MSNDLLLSEIQTNVRENPTIEAAIEWLGGQERRISFLELWRAGETAKGALEQYSSDDQIVPIFAKRSINTLAVILGCIMSGKTFALLNNRLRYPQVEAAILGGSAGTIWVDDTTIAELNKGVQHSGVMKRVQVCAVQDSHWGSFQCKQLAKLEQHAKVKMVSLEDKFQNSAHVEYTKGRAASCLFTSGSTGIPKGVFASADDLTFRARSELACFDLHPGDRILNVLPWSFDVGLSQTLCMFLGGCTLAIVDSWLPAEIIGKTKEYEVDGISAVPSLWLDILSSGLRFSEPAPRYVTVSGGSLPIARLQELAKLLPQAEIIRTYGQTETCRSAIAFRTDIAECPESIGRRYPGTHVYIVDKDLKAVEVGQEGELLHAGDGTMLGYLGIDDEKKRVKNPFFGIDGDCSEFAILTGDRARVDETGRIFLHGRHDDLVKIQGNRVHLVEVLAKVHEFPNVFDAQVLSYESQDKTQIALFVVFSEDNSLGADKLLKKHLSTRLPPYMVPAAVHVLESMPRTTNGKVDRTGLSSLLNN